MHFCLILIFLVAPVFAYQTSLSPSGHELFWANTNVPLTINTNTSDLSATQVRSIVTNSMSQWNQSSPAKLSSAVSSTNQIKFVSSFPYGSAVIGVTELSYNSAGAIQGGSVLLNDNYFFRGTPGLYPSGEVYLGDVVTHELGHLLGISHSEVLNSSMFYSSFSGQSSLSSDDIGGIRAKYDSSYGTISGYMKGGDSIGVLGVHVQAISRNTGEAIAAISDETGYFAIDGLDLNDSYYLYTSPVKKPESLPGYFANVQDSFCPGTYVGSFFSPCGREFDGRPTPINLTAQNSAVDVGVVTINCSLRSDQDYSLRKLSSTFSPLSIFDYGLEQSPQKAFVGWFRKSTVSTWSGSDVFLVNLTEFASLSPQKYLKVSLVSYPFGSMLEYSMTVKQNGSLVSSASRGLSYSSTLETYNTDFSAFIPLSSTASANNFEISISSRKLSTSFASQTFPSFAQFANEQHMPYLLVASIYESVSGSLRPLLDSEALLSDNDSCLDAPFTYQVSKTESATNDSQSSSDQTLAATGCGTIEPPSNGPGSSLPLLSAGFLVTLIASSLLKTRKKFLS